MKKLLIVVFLSSLSLGAVTAPTADGKLFLGYDATDVVVDGNGRVTQWTDQIGDYDAAATTAAPYLETVNTGNGLHPVLSFRGSCFLKTASFAAPLQQRNAIFLVSSRIGYKNDYLFDGLDVTNRHGLVSRANFTYGMVATKQIINENVSTTVNTDPNTANYVEIFTLLFQGATSEMRINGTKVLGGDVGNAALGGLTLGAWYNGTSAFNGKIAEFLLYNGSLTSDEVSAVENYLRNKYQVTENPQKAANPAPLFAQTTNITDGVSLSWTAGSSAVSHNLYLGQSKDDVAAATPQNPLGVFQGTLTSTAFTPDALEFGKTYYWRVDEVDAASQVYTGDVWQFATADSILVDNFDNYGGESQMLADWQPLGGGIAMFSTAEYISYLNSMALYYSNTASPFFSAAKRTFSPAADFSQHSMAAIDIKLKGSSTNSDAMFSMTLSDGINSATQSIEQSVTTVLSTGWVTRRFALSGFTGVDISNVVSLTITIGDGSDPQAVSEGQVLIDDIRLYQVRCLGGYPANDLNRDCIIDIADFASMAASWYESGLWPAD